MVDQVIPLGVFLKVEGSKARCIDCNSLVSDIIERLRNHRKHCHSLSSSTQQEPDLIFESSPQPSPLKSPETCQPQMSSFTIRTESAAASRLDLQIDSSFMPAIYHPMLLNTKNLNQ